MAIANYVIYDRVALIMSTQGDAPYCTRASYGYIVNADDNKQMKFIQDKVNNENSKLVILENKGFKLTIDKLLYDLCICKLEKDNETYMIEVEYRLLFGLIKYNNIKEGVCERPVMLIKKGTKYCFVTDNMPDYQDAIDTENRKKLVSSKKTNKYDFGGVYSTLYLNHTYLGKIHKLIDLKYAFSSDGGSYLIAVPAKDKQVHVLYRSGSVVNNTINTVKFSSLIDSWINAINKNVIRISDLFGKSEIPIFNSYNYVPKLPYRSKTGVNIDVDIDIRDAYQLLIDEAQSKVIEYIRDKKYPNDLLDLASSVLIRLDTFENTELTENELEILRFIKQYADISNELNYEI